MLTNLYFYLSLLFTHFNQVFKFSCLISKLELSFGRNLSNVKMDINQNDNSKEQCDVMFLHQISPNVQYSFVTKCENGESPKFIAECKLEDGNVG